jgi:hypothetical protein
MPLFIIVAMQRRRRSTISNKKRKAAIQTSNLLFFPSAQAPGFTKQNGLPAIFLSLQFPPPIDNELTPAP